MVVASREIVSSQEGTVTDASNTVSTCDANGHLGTYVYVDNIKYGHLSSIAPGVTVGAHLLQGDAIGVQGNTGNTLPPTCGEHLHWEFGGVRYGDPLPTIDGGSGVSTNSVIGEYSQSGATLRQAFVDHGGWGSVGWTVNLGSGLNMAQDFSWGKLQDFQHDPDGLGGGTNNTLTVRASDQTHAYLVDSVFWATWAAANPRLGLPLADRGACPVGFSRLCLSYQPFQFGFVWMDVFTGRTAVFCPDVSHNGVFDSNDIALIMARSARRTRTTCAQFRGHVS
jgi:hypothetical protein